LNFHLGTAPGIPYSGSTANICNWYVIQSTPITVISGGTCTGTTYSTILYMYLIYYGVTNEWYVVAYLDGNGGSFQSACFCASVADGGFGAGSISSLTFTNAQNGSDCGSGTTSVCHGYPFMGTSVTAGINCGGTATLTW